jgi:hypothetical protein
MIMNNYYLPALEKYAYRIHHVRILSKDFCGKERFEAFKKRPGDVNTRRDYAGRLSAKFNLEIQSFHFGNGRSLSMEGSSVEVFSAPAIVNAEANPRGDYSGSITMESQSHFSDKSKQYASTTHAHMLVLLEYLFENNVMKIGSTEWQDTDGCGKQYRCGTALYLLSLLASQKHVVIDRAIGAPGHGKDIVDGLNATDKRFLKGEICLIGSPEANNFAQRMVAHSMVEGASKSLAEECARLCSDEARTSGVKGSMKSEKRETNSELKLRKKKQSHNGLLAHYNIRVERDLGIGMAALRRIPCACDGCINQIDLNNVRARYASSITCKYWGIFEGLVIGKSPDLSQPPHMIMKMTLVKQSRWYFTEWQRRLRNRSKLDKLSLFLQMTQTPMVIMLLNGHQSRTHYRKPSLL